MATRKNSSRKRNGYTRSHSKSVKHLHTTSWLKGDKKAAKMKFIPTKVGDYYITR